MVEIATPGGAVSVPDESIFRIQGPRPQFPHTQVFWSGGAGAIETEEAPDHLAARLQLNHPLAVLTRPDGNPVWIKASAVTYVGPPLTNDRPDPPAFVRARMMVSGRLQLVQEDPSTVREILATGAGVA
jgi:hypothetical protein